MGHGYYNLFILFFFNLAEAGLENAQPAIFLIWRRHIWQNIELPQRVTPNNKQMNIN